MKLMERLDYKVHPNYVESVLTDGHSRPTRMEVQAKGKQFVAELSHPRGGGVPGSNSYLTTSQVAAKFSFNTKGVLPDGRANELLQRLTGLGEVKDIGTIMRLTGPGA